MEFAGALREGVTPCGRALPIAHAHALLVLLALPCCTVALDFSPGALQPSLDGGERDALPAGRTLLGRSTPCVGREHELDILSSLLEQSLSEPTARVVLVTAAPGVGKSRLTSEFLRRVEARLLPLVPPASSRPA